MPNKSKLPRRMRERPFLNDLPRRAYLTAKHEGWRELFLRLLTSPLRLVGLERAVRTRFADLFAPPLPPAPYSCLVPA
jgi:hypothetical protein